MKIVAIHQPNFFPWLGYFEKIARSDVFIFLDDTQFPKAGGVWTNRVKLLINGQAHWVTAPINRSFSGVKPICDITFPKGNPWREKMLKSIALNYSKAPHFEETMHLIEPLILNEETNIAAYNIHAIKAVSNYIGLDSTQFLLSSQLPHDGFATDLLISLINTVQGTEDRKSVV